MTPEIYAEWLRRQGQRVVRTESSYWHSEGMRVYQAFPYHRLITPVREELRELTSHHRALAMRYSTPHVSGDGPAAYHAVYTGADYDFDNLSSWARKNVRRGLRLCKVTQIPLDRYIEEGWTLRLDTLARQRRHLKEAKDSWRRRYGAIVGLEGFEIWASQVNDRLAATLVTFQMDGWAYMVYQQCHRDFLREHANNALSFVVTQHLVRKPEVQGVFYGMQSVDAPATVDEFKFRMGYEAKPVRQKIVFNPYISPFVNTVSYSLVKVAHRCCPEHRFLAKAEGVLRLSRSSRLAMQPTQLSSSMEKENTPCD